MAAIAAQYGCKMLKTDTNLKHAFLNGEVGEGKIYCRPPDWWPEPVPQVHALLLMKCMYGTAGSTSRISGWMESHDYMAVNNERNGKDPTSFMKWEGSDFIMDELLVDDMTHASTSQKRIKRFMNEYSKDFEYARGDFMTSFLGLEVEQDKGQIQLHLDIYVNEMLEDYKANIMPKKIPMYFLKTKENTNAAWSCIDKVRCSRNPRSKRTESVSIICCKSTVCSKLGHV
jgi:hypothetical protein